MKRDLSIMLKCSVLISLAVVLGRVCVLKMPYGGSVNFSPVPIVVASMLFGSSWGLYTGFTYSLIKLLLGFSAPPAVNFLNVLACILLDYIIPYTSLGLVSLVKIKEKNSIFLGLIIVTAIRLASTTVSGVLIWQDILSINKNIFWYSLVYNSTYIIPEAILSIIICPVIINFLNTKFKENLK